MIVDETDEDNILNEDTKVLQQTTSTIITPNDNPDVTLTCTIISIVDDVSVTTPVDTTKFIISVPI